MTYSEAIRSGFKLINDKWQLIVVQVALTVMNLIGFFIIVGIPLGVAFIIFGLDLTGISDLKDILALFRNPAELVSKYFGLILLVLACFLIYVTLVTTAGVYIFSGSIGLIGRSIADPSTKFSSKNFFSEARKHFFPLIWYSLVAGLVFLLITFGLGLFGGIVAAVVSAAKGQDSTLALFLGIFFSLVLVLIGSMFILSALAVTVYGIAALYFRDDGPVAAFKNAFRFLWVHQQAFWLYAVLLAGYIFLSFFIMLVVFPFKLIPIIGTVISFPFQILSYIAQSYLGLVILAVIFRYYYEMEIRPGLPPELLPETDTAPIADTSMSPEDISAPKEEGPAQSLQEPAPIPQSGPQTDPQKTEQELS